MQYQRRARTPYCAPAHSKTQADDFVAPSVFAAARFFVLLASASASEADARAEAEYLRLVARGMELADQWRDLKGAAAVYRQAIELRPEKANSEFAYRIDPLSRYKNLRADWREAAA